MMWLIFGYICCECLLALAQVYQSCKTFKQLHIDEVVDYGDDELDQDFLIFRKLEIKTTDEVNQTQTRQVEVEMVGVGKRTRSRRLR